MIFEWFVRLFSLFAPPDEPFEDEEPQRAVQFNVLEEEVGQGGVYIDQVDSVCSTLTVRHREHEGIGYDRGYSTASLMLFPSRGVSLLWPFLDLRAHRFTDNELAANLGVGFRYDPTFWGLVYGLNAYFDYRSDHNHNFHFTQSGLGIEVLSNRMDFRANGYLPIKKKRTLQRCRFFYPGGFFIFRDRLTHALTGFDAEVGIHWTDRYSRTLFYTAVGPYYFGGKVCRKAMGGKGRVLIQFAQFMTIEGIVSHDNVYNTRFQGQVGIHFPFGCSPGDSTRQRVLSQPVIRNDMIVLDEMCKWKFNY